MEISIRPMIEADWPAVAKIYGQGIATGKATFQSEIPAYSDWNSSHITECRFVAESSGSIAGWAALSKTSSRCVYGGVAEVSIYIAESCRKKGVGETLFNYLISESEKAGYWTLQSGIMENNEASIRLHEKCGFRKIGFRERIARDVTGKWRNTVLMERRSKVTGID